MTRFGSRSAQSFKPPTPSAAPSSQRPAIPAPRLPTSCSTSVCFDSSSLTTPASNVSFALSTYMETPSSSTTTPSPLLGYLRPEPVPSSSKVANGPVDMGEVQERQQAIQKFLAGAEMSKVCASHVPPPTSGFPDASTFSKRHNPMPLRLDACVFMRGSPPSRRL